MSNGSWLDADATCQDQGGHLWSINSYDEWWNVYQATTTASIYDHDGYQDTTYLLMVSALLFIGLRKANSVR